MDKLVDKEAFATELEVMFKHRTEAEREEIQRRYSTASHTGTVRAFEQLEELNAVRECEIHASDSASSHTR